MDAPLKRKHIALLATEGFEDSELTKPLEALQGSGATVTVISEEIGEFAGKNGTKIKAEKTVSDVSSSDFDGLLLPGGVANPDQMRMNSDAISFIQCFFSESKPVAAICHAPWLLIEANVLDGKTLTSWPSLRTDITNAGGNWVDEPVVVDRNLVTSRNPDDIPVFNAKAIQVFAEGAHQ